MQLKVDSAAPPLYFNRESTGTIPIDSCRLSGDRGSLQGCVAIDQSAFGKLVVDGPAATEAVEWLCSAAVAKPAGDVWGGRPTAALPVENHSMLQL